jgi:hypothetical protein
VTARQAIRRGHEHEPNDGVDAGGSERVSLGVILQLDGYLTVLSHIKHLA